MSAFRTSIKIHWTKYSTLEERQLKVNVRELTGFPDEPVLEIDEVTFMFADRDQLLSVKAAIDQYLSDRPPVAEVTDTPVTRGEVE